MAQKRSSTPTRSASKKSAVSISSSSVLPSGNSFSKKRIKIAAVVIVVLALLFFAKGMFIAALVNGTPVSRLSVISQLEKQGGKSALDTLITQTLISNEAGKRNISVSQSELDTQLKTIQTNVEKQGSTLDVALASQGMTKADLTNQLKLELLLNKMIGQSQQVTDKEIDDYITQNKAQLPQNEDENTLRAQIKQQLLQQKQQQQAQQFIQNLRNKAKITYFVNY